MKKRNLFALAAAAILLAACIPSVCPFYTDKDVVFDGRLLGEWQAKDNTNDPETWTFEKSTNNAYKLTVVEPQGKTGEFAAHLFKLKQEQFLDLIPTDCNYATNQADLVAFSMFPGHLLVNVRQIEPELSLAFCDFDWLEKYLAQNPGHWRTIRRAAALCSLPSRATCRSSSSNISEPTNCSRISGRWRGEQTEFLQRTTPGEQERAAVDTCRDTAAICEPRRGNGA